MKLLIVSERPETALWLSALLTAIGHEPYVTAVHGSDMRTAVDTAAMLEPYAILLDAPSVTPAAMSAVRTLQGDFTTRWIPTVLLTDATRRDTERWSTVQRGLDHRVCMLPFHGAPNALYRLVGVLHGLAPRSGEMIGN